MDSKTPTTITPMIVTTTRSSMSVKPRAKGRISGARTAT
jgi:hypothetical protein